MALGIAHPDILLAGLSASQWGEWCVYSEIEPFGELRSDFRAGQVAATIANFAGKSRTQGLPPLTPADFMPALREYVPEQPAANDGILLDDPAEQSKLIKQLIFKVKE